MRSKPLRDAEISLDVRSRFADAQIRADIDLEVRRDQIGERGIHSVDVALSPVVHGIDEEFKLTGELGNDLAAEIDQIDEVRARRRHWRS